MDRQQLVGISPVISSVPKSSEAISSHGHFLPAIFLPADVTASQLASRKGRASKLIFFGKKM